MGFIIVPVTRQLQLYVLVKLGLNQLQISLFCLFFFSGVLCVLYTSGIPYRRCNLPEPQCGDVCLQQECGSGYPAWQKATTWEHVASNQICSDKLRRAKKNCNLQQSSTKHFHPQRSHDFQTCRWIPEPVDSQLRRGLCFLNCAQCLSQVTVLRSSLPSQ